jgi:probable F420-dependent oxidoreductase
MEIGAVFPQARFGSERGLIREFAETAERLGYSHLLAYDHVLGASHTGRELNGPYTEHDPFHEPMVLFGFFAGVTSRIELGTAVIILPQRQAALVAKQAAEVDVLSGGRFRLGVGIGWNRIEYEALNEDFSNRGARCEEQVEVMRRLWTESLVDFEGRWHRIDRASILPRPARPIPVWFGGATDKALRRGAKLGDGFIFPAYDDAVIEQIARLRRYLAESDRDGEAFGLQVFLDYGAGPEAWRSQLEACRVAGVSHVAMRSTRAGLPTPEAHIDALHSFADFARLAPVRA